MANKKRPNQVILRLSDKELRKFHEKVDEAEMKQQSFLLMAALGTPIIHVDAEVLRELLVELKREGNNLNQIARRLNEGGIVSTQELDKTRKELESLWPQLKQYLEATR